MKHDGLWVISFGWNAFFGVLAAIEEYYLMGSIMLFLALILLILRIQPFDKKELQRGITV